MIAIIFAKNSQRLQNKHNMEICREKMIDRISRILSETGRFSNIILFTKNFSLKSKFAVTEEDNTDGILFDSILYCIERYHEFLAIGGDMPYIDKESIENILDNYKGNSVAYMSDNFYQPLFAIYSTDVEQPMLKYRKNGKGSIRKFMNEYSMLYIEGDQEKLKSINTEKDLIEARKNLRCL